MDATTYATEHLATEDLYLSELVRELSRTWPNVLAAARQTDLPITPEKLAVVVAGWDRLDFADAFLRCDLEAIRARASNPVTSDACIGLGAHLLSAIDAHARYQLIQRVELHRSLRRGA